MTNGDRATVTVGGIVVILLLLLWWKLSPHTIINNVHDKDVKIDVETGPVTNYNLPPLVIPNVGGAWDWMQTTDLACGCDAGLWKQPMEIAPATALPQSYPVYKYVIDTQYSAGPTYDFPVYVAPPLPTWHWEYGWNVHNEERMYPTTSDGQTYIGGKYSRKADAYGQHNQQTKTGSLTGADMYVGGKHYVHDATKDQVRPSVYSEGRVDSDAFIRQGWTGPIQPGQVGGGYAMAFG